MTLVPEELLDQANEDRAIAEILPFSRQIKETLSGAKRAATAAVQPVVEQISQFQVPELSDLAPDLFPRQPSGPQASAMPQNEPPQYSVPELEEIDPGLFPRQSQQAPQPGASTVAAHAVEMPQGMPGASALPVGDESDEAYARRKAASLGIDPERAVLVANNEGGFELPNRQSDYINPNTGRREESYGPFQLNMEGGLGAEALKRGIDARNPAHVRQAIDFALEHAARNGWEAFRGAKRAGLGNWDGIGSAQPQTAQSSAPTAPAPGPQAVAMPQGGGAINLEYPRQDQLSDPDKWAVCGPLAAMAAASWAGKPIDYETAKAKARAAGWTPANGMAGPDSQVALLQSIGVPSYREAVNWEKVRRDVRNGNPVFLSAPGSEGHYYTVQGVDDQGRLDLGNSALTLRASGGSKRWWTPEELRAIGPIGNVTNAIYVDNPTSPTPSSAVAATRMPPATEETAAEGLASITPPDQAPPSPAPAPVASSSAASSPAADSATGSTYQMNVRGGPVDVSRQELAGYEEDTADSDAMLQQQAARPEPTPNDVWTSGTGVRPATVPEQQTSSVWERGMGMAPELPGLAETAGTVGGALDTFREEHPGGFMGGIRDLLVHGAEETDTRVKRLSELDRVREEDPDYWRAHPELAQEWIDTAVAVGQNLQLSAPEVGIGRALRTGIGKVLPDAMNAASIPVARVADDARSAVSRGLDALGRALPEGEVAVGLETRPTPRVVNSAADRGIGTLFHETDPTQALSFTRSVGDAVTGLNVASDPAYALGQGGKGALVEFGNLDRIGVQPVRAKPGAQMVEAATGTVPEYQITRAAGHTAELVKSITLRPDAELDYVARRLRDALPKQGWQVETLADGSTRYTNPAFGLETRPVQQAAESGVNLPPGVGPAATRAAVGATAGAASERYDPANYDEDGNYVQPSLGSTLGRAALGAGAGLLAGGRRAAGLIAEPVGGRSGNLIPGKPPTPRRPRPVPGAQRIALSTDEEIARVRLDKFPEEVRDTIAEAARDADWARGYRRGVIPDDVAEELAARDRSSADDWIRRARGGKAYNEEEALALRNTYAGQAAIIRDLTEEIAQSRANNIVPDLLIARRVLESERLAGMVNVVEGARAEAGRSLRAWRFNAKILEDNPQEAIRRIYEKLGGRDDALKVVDEFTKLIQDGAGPVEQAKFWQRVEKGPITTGDVLEAIRYNSMLSSPRTWEIGWVGSVFQAALKIPSDLMAAASRPGSGEFGQAAAGALVGIQRGIRPMLETIMHGVTEQQALGGALPKGLAARAESPVGKALATAIDVPGRMVAAPDAFFTSVFHQAELGRQAAIDAYQKGLKGAERAAFIRDYLDNPSDEALKRITKTVDSLMLRGETGGVGKMFPAAARMNPLVASFVMPFYKVSYHIWTQGVELTPVGAIGTAVDAARGLAGKGPYAKGFGAEAAEHVRPLAERARYNAMGLGITAAATWQALQGNITGAGPDDAEKRDMLRTEGWQPYSVRIGGKWVSYANWGPVAVPLASAAAYAENKEYAKPDATPEDAWMDMLGRTTKLVTEQSFLQSVGAIWRAIDEPDRYGPQWLGNMMTSLVPYGAGLNTVAQAMDEEAQRRPDRVADVGVREYLGQTAAQRIPGLRETVPESQDVLGKTMPNEQAGALAFQPFRASTVRSNPTIRAFLEAGVDIGKPKDALTVDGVKITLTPKEQRQWQTLRGETLERVTPGLTQRAWWKQPEAREAALKDVLRDANTAADAKLQQQIGTVELRRRLRESAEKMRKAS